MAENLPYVTSIGTLEKMLEKISMASVPERFTQDFVSTKLSMKGGSARAIIPFIKKMGLVASDGTPTDLYKQFRNSEKSGSAVAKAMKNLYQRLYEMNEYVHDATHKELVGLIVEATGATEESRVSKLTLGTFNVLKKLADFDAEEEQQNIEVQNGSSTTTEIPQTIQLPPPETHHHTKSSSKGMNLSYTINLNLPATSDIEVFNAIFKSLKEHLLEG